MKPPQVKAAPNADISMALVMLVTFWGLGAWSIAIFDRATQMSDSAERTLLKIVVVIGAMVAFCYATRNRDAR